MKLLKLKSFAYNALRETIWTPVTLGTYPFEHVLPKKSIAIDLVGGILLPGREGDDVEIYYKAMAR